VKDEGDADVLEGMALDSVTLALVRSYLPWDLLTWLVATTRRQADDDFRFSISRETRCSHPRDFCSLACQIK
jgi:hypothetical protein